MNGHGCAQVSHTAQRVTALPGADDSRCADVWGLIGGRLKVRIGAPARRHVLARSRQPSEHAVSELMSPETDSTSPARSRPLTVRRDPCRSVRPGRIELHDSGGSVVTVCRESRPVGTSARPSCLGRCRQYFADLLGPRQEDETFVVSYNGDGPDLHGRTPACSRKGIQAQGCGGATNIPTRSGSSAVFLLHEEVGSLRSTTLCTRLVDMVALPSRCHRGCPRWRHAGRRGGQRSACAQALRWLRT